jgi:hypothetical protein
LIQKKTGSRPSRHQAGSKQVPLFLLKSIHFPARPIRSDKDNIPV